MGLVGAVTAARPAAFTVPPSVRWPERRQVAGLRAIGQVRKAIRAADVTARVRCARDFPNIGEHTVRKTAGTGGGDRRGFRAEAQLCRQAADCRVAVLGAMLRTTANHFGLGGRWSFDANIER